MGSHVASPGKIASSARNGAGFDLVGRVIARAGLSRI